MLAGCVLSVEMEYLRIVSIVAVLDVNRAQIRFILINPASLSTATLTVAQAARLTNRYD
jgi:hypothetical protein